MEVGSRGVGWRSLIGGGRAEILVDHDWRLRRRIASGDIGRRLGRLRGSVAGTVRKCGGASGDSWRGHVAPRIAAGRSMPQARKNDVAKATDRPVLGGERSNG